MQSIAKIFFRGLLAFLPVFLTIYLLYYFGTWLNRISNHLLSFVAPDLAELPGLGIVIGVAGILVLGLVTSSRLTRWLYNLVETPLRHLPIIKELYLALKQLTDFLSPKDKKQAGQVVSVKYPGYDAAMIGLLMREDIQDIGFADAVVGWVGVYLPMSYQLGGFTVFVPRDWITEVDIPVETALRGALTGWMQSKSEG